VPDARLGHDGMVTASLIALIMVGSDMRATPPSLRCRRDALERHDGDGASLLGDARLLDVDDVHDDATLEHLID
jgi:hypothetical protein